MLAGQFAELPVIAVACAKRGELGACFGRELAGKILRDLAAEAVQLLPGAMRRPRSEVAGLLGRW